LRPSMPCSPGGPFSPRGPRGPGSPFSPGARRSDKPSPLPSPFDPSSSPTNGMTPQAIESNRMLTRGARTILCVAPVISEFTTPARIVSFSDVLCLLSEHWASVQQKPEREERNQSPGRLKRRCRRRVVLGESTAVDGFPECYLFGQIGTRRWVPCY